MAFTTPDAKKSNCRRTPTMAPGTQKILCLQGYTYQTEKNNASKKIAMAMHTNVYNPAAS
jgi:hypothetical protein